MVQTIIAWGQRGSYLFECTSKRYSAQLPAPVKTLITENKIKNTYCLTVGKGDSYVITYQGTDGMQHLQAQGVPESLHEWLYQRDENDVLVRELDQLKVTLGPYNASYFATDGKHLKWSALPAELEKAIKENRNPDGTWKPSSCPRLVALGAAGNYIMITEGNGGSWILSKYPGLKELVELLRDKGFSVIANIVLNPYRMLNYALEAKNGVVLFENNMPHATDHAELFVAAVKEDVEQEELEKQRQQAENEAARIRLANQLAQQRAELQRIQQLQQFSNGVRNAMIMTNLINAFTFANLN